MTTIPHNSYIDAAKHLQDAKDAQRVIDLILELANLLQHCYQVHNSQRNDAVCIDIKEAHARVCCWLYFALKAKKTNKLRANQWSRILQGLMTHTDFRINGDVLERFFITPSLFEEQRFKMRSKYCNALTLMCCLFQICQTKNETF